MSDFFADLELQLIAATRDRPRRRRRAQARRAAGGLAVAAVLGAGLAGGVLAAGGDGGPATHRPAAPAPARRPATGPAVTSPSSRVTVAVLNATTVPGLARGVAVRLQAAGFTKIGTVTNAPTQTGGRTRVAYRPGHADDALGVAAALHVTVDRDGPLRAGTDLARATRGADVVVLVGPDLDSRPKG
jgi:hypothetical protein